MPGEARGAALDRARRLIPPLEARLLLCNVIGISAVALAAHDDVVLTGAEAAAYADLVRRRLAGEPIAYLTGEREFYGRVFALTPDVLIPRPETELLVDLGRAKTAGLARPRLLDLGTGSGCLAVTLACELPRARVAAVDRSLPALRVAKDNGIRHGAAVSFFAGDWFAAVKGQFDLIVANPPYVADGDPHLARGDPRFEPRTALAGGADGLVEIRRIVATAPAFLSSGGWLFVEHGYDQGEAVAGLMDRAGFAAVESHRDLAGIRRATGGRRG